MTMYQESSLEDIAHELSRLAKACRDRSITVDTELEKRELAGQTNAYHHAAYILRRTTLTISLTEPHKE